MKKSKAIGIIVGTIVLVACIVVAIVLLTSRVSFNLNSSVNFESDNVCVKVNGDIKTVDDINNLPNKAASYKYVGYSYDAVKEEAETGGEFDDTPVSATTIDMVDWTIGKISFDKTNKIIQYEFKFKNYSEFPVVVTISNYNNAVGEMPSLTQTFEALKEKGVTAEENVTNGELNLQAYAGGNAQEKSYIITLTLTDFSASFTQDLALSFTFKKEPSASEQMHKVWTETIQDVEYKFINIGKYPQTYVGNELNTTLENLFDTGSSNLVATGKSYTGYDAGVAITPYVEYVYNDEEYVRVPNADVFNDGSKTFIDGTPVITGETYWFKVEPIQWRILTENYTDEENTTPVSYLLSEYCLTANITFGRSLGVPNNTSHYSSELNVLRPFLDNVFYNEAFTEDEKILMAKRTLKDSDLDATLYNENDPDLTIASTEALNVFAPTYYDMININYGFNSSSSNSDLQRRASATDFAMANYACKLDNSNFQDVHGIESTYYWTSSAHAQYMSSHLVLSYGYLYYNFVNLEFSSVRPAMLFKI